MTRSCIWTFSWRSVKWTWWVSVSSLEFFVITYQKNHTFFSTKRRHKARQNTHPKRIFFLDMCVTKKTMGVRGQLLWRDKQLWTMLSGRGDNKQLVVPTSRQHSSSGRYASLCQFHKKIQNCCFLPKLGLIARKIKEMKFYSKIRNHHTYREFGLSDPHQPQQFFKPIGLFFALVYLHCILNPGIKH